VRSLTPKLRDLALLREQHPDASLTMLGEMMDPPLKKSGVNNRMKRIIEFAEKL
jgi:DNA-binding protein WhiA